MRTSCRNELTLKLGSFSHDLNDPTSRRSLAPDSRYVVHPPPTAKLNYTILDSVYSAMRNYASTVMIPELHKRDCLTWA